MKIISKFKDFYDSAQALGVDDKILYKRFQSAYSINNLNGYVEFNREIWNSLPDPHVIYLNGEYEDPRKEQIRIIYSSIGFCGKLYPFVSFVLEKNDIQVNRSTFYKVDKLNEYLDKLSKRYPKLIFKDDYYRCERPTKKEFDLYLNSKVFEPERINWFQEIKAPVFTFVDSPNTYIQIEEAKLTNKSNLGYIIINPILKEFEFFKIIDNYSCFQALFQFISGVLSERDTISDSLTEKEQVNRFGFDPKYGFRTRPKKK